MDNIVVWLCFRYGEYHFGTFFLLALATFFYPNVPNSAEFPKKRDRIIKIFPRNKINVFEVQKLHVNSVFHAAGNMDHEIHFKENRIEQTLLSYYIGNIYVFRRLLLYL